MITILAEGRRAGIDPQRDRATATTITAVRTAPGDMGFTAECGRAVAAITSMDEDSELVEEHENDRRTPLATLPWAPGLPVLEVRQGVDSNAVAPDHPVPHLEMEVWAGGITGHPDPADLPRSTDLLTNAHEDGGHVIVGGEQAAAVGDPDLEAAPVVLPTRPDHGARRGGQDRGAFRRGDIEGWVGGMEVLADPAARNRPIEGAAVIARRRLGVDRARAYPGDRNWPGSGDRRRDRLCRRG